MDLLVGGLIGVVLGYFVGWLISMEEIKGGGAEIAKKNSNSSGRGSLVVRRVEKIPYFINDAGKKIILPEGYTAKDFGYPVTDSAIKYDYRAVISREGESGPSACGGPVSGGCAAGSEPERRPYGLSGYEKKIGGEWFRGKPDEEGNAEWTPNKQYEFDKLADFSSASAMLLSSGQVVNMDLYYQAIAKQFSGFLPEAWALLKKSTEK